jgi:hypothetical protein
LDLLQQKENSIRRPTKMIPPMMPSVSATLLFFFCDNAADVGALAADTLAEDMLSEDALTENTPAEDTLAEDVGKGDEGDEGAEEVVTANKSRL